MAVALWGTCAAQVLSPAGSILQSLNTQTGAEATALGGAFSSLADDPNAVYWNPAGIAWTKRPEIQTTYNQWFLDTFFQDLEGVLPTPWGGLGARLSYFNFGSFDLRDSAGTPQGSQTPQAWGGSVAAGSRWGDFGIGLSADAAQENYPNYSVGGIGLGGGMLYRSNWGGLSLGARNFGQAAGYNLPTEYYGGASVHFGKSAFRVLLATDATYQSVSPVLHHGLELGFDQVFFLRGGYQWVVRPQPSQDEAGFGGGIGLHLGDFKLDYSIVSYGDLGLTNKIAVGFVFGKQVAPRSAPTPLRQAALPQLPPAHPPAVPPSASPAPTMLALYRAGLGAYRQGQYRDAAEFLEKAVATPDPKVPDYYYAEAYDVLGILYEYHAKYPGHLDTARQFYHAALGKEPGNETALKHLKDLQ